MTTFRGITVRQPWASCIASEADGAKRVENRASFFSYRGTLLIHAGTSPDLTADTDPRVTWLYGRDPRVGKPVGAVVAVAELVDVHEAVDIDTLTGDPGVCCEPWGERVYSARRAKHLVLANVRGLDRPVRSRGALGLWVPSQRVVDDVLAQVDVEAVAR